MNDVINYLSRGNEARKNGAYSIKVFASKTKINSNRRERERDEGESTQKATSSTHC